MKTWAITPEGGPGQPIELEESIHKVVARYPISKDPIAYAVYENGRTDGRWMVAPANDLTKIKRFHKKGDAITELKRIAGK